MLRIENNKGFFEGAEMRERQGARDQQTQQNEAEYLRLLQDQMAKQRAAIATSMSEPHQAKDRADALNYINQREHELMNMGTSNKLWQVQEDGRMIKGNVYKPKATRQHNLQRQYDLMQRPDGTLKNEYSIYGTAFDPNMGFYNTNRQGHGVAQYLPGGKRIWGSVHTSNLPLEVR